MWKWKLRRKMSENWFFWHFFFLIFSTFQKYKLWIRTEQKCNIDIFFISLLKMFYKNQFPSLTEKWNSFFLAFQTKKLSNFVIKLRIRFFCLLFFSLHTTDIWNVHLWQKSRLPEYKIAYVSKKWFIFGLKRIIFTHTKTFDFT